jgi:hypothetical protein
MRWLTLLMAASLAAAPPKLSPLLSECDRAFVVAVRDEIAARRLAADRGWRIVEHTNLLPGHMIVTGEWETAASLAESESVAYVFPAAPELLDGEPVVACSGALIGDGLAPPYTAFGQGWPAGPAGAEVGYLLLNSPDRLPAERVAAEVMRAFSQWSAHANLRFVPASEPQASRTIAIRFAQGSHGDSYPFDGRGRILAHTFYPAPPNPEPLAGDMHLDAEEAWAIGENTDLFTVVLHELGHALGLGHSDRPGAVMYPYYRFAATLSSDDIEGIRSLYGDKDAAPPPPAPGPQPLKITVTSPSGFVSTPAASIGLEGKVEGGQAPIMVRWQSDRGPAGPALGSTDWRVDGVPLSDGVNRISVAALDKEGANATHTVTVTKVAQQPAAPAPLQPLSLRVTYPGMSIIGVSSPSITIRGQSSGAESVTWSSSAGFSGEAAGAAVWTAEVPLHVGNNTVTLHAVSSTGRSVWRSLTVVRR